MSLSVYFGIVFVTILVSIMLDYTILSEISAYNKRKNIKYSHNKLFSQIFIVLRMFLPDVFLISTLTGIVTKITLNRKQIIRLVIISQLLRLLIIIILFVLRFL